MLLNKMEIKRQKDKLVLYNKSLPSLKKKQSLLQTQIIRFENEIIGFEKEINTLESKIQTWIAVFAEELEMPQIKLVDSKYSLMNIAGIDITHIDTLTFDADYDMKQTPWWVDDAVILLKKVAEFSIKIVNSRKNIEIIRGELEITNQRINLFEKRLIPETEENIRKIKIFLGDQQTAAVCRAKITKKKKEKKGEIV